MCMCAHVKVMLYRVRVRVAYRKFKYLIIYIKLVATKIIDCSNQSLSLIAANHYGSSGTVLSFLYLYCSGSSPHKRKTPAMPPELCTYYSIFAHAQSLHRLSSMSLVFGHAQFTSIIVNVTLFIILRTTNFSFPLVPVFSFQND